MTRFSIVAAVARNGVIGRNGALPWRLPDDLARFRRLTMGHTVLMGRRTFESIGRPLDGRRNVVLSRDPAFRPTGVLVARSVEEALSSTADDGEVFVIGGSAVYRLFLARADRLLFTLVDAEPEGDVFFPPWESASFREVERLPHPTDERHDHSFSFVTLERITK